MHLLRLVKNNEQRLSFHWSSTDRALLLTGCSTTYNISGDVKPEVYGDLIATERDTFEVLNDAKLGL